MPRQAVTFRSLPTEIITRIFILSSNPSLVLICRELNHILAPLSKSTAIRTEFLLVRYRNNYVKAVVKGLRWSFFDLELLNALDRLYLKAKTSRRLCKALSTTRLDTMTPGMSSGQKVLTLSSTRDVSSPSNPNTSRRSDPQEPPRKKRKKYAAPDQDPSSSSKTAAAAAGLPTETMDCQEIRIRLPKDFSMPRRLFKSSDHLPLIRALLIRGASPSLPSHYPLVRASQRGDVEMVKTLFEFGALPEMTALRWACVEENDEILDLFLEMGVQPDDQCLSWCVDKGKTRMIDRLLKLGVVPDLKTLIGF
ncbi:MAG: hypothetical protein J3Q66DRAFT_351966 [Benniella sp.]|nr:MAG: hypothetical protein J3Q66DRAFT_351966 [Benniella sp.]